MSAEARSYLPEGLPRPGPAIDGLGAEFWEAAKRHELVVQQCRACEGFQWGPEWICHNCHSDDLVFEEVPPVGRIYSFERVWHPVHPALKDQGPYIVVLVEFPEHDQARIVGNLLGDPHQDVAIGDEVHAVFEHHQDEDPAFTLVQWQVA